MSDFQLAKLWLGGTLGMSKDALHISVGLVLFLLAAALLRRPLRDWRPLAVVLVAALAGEAWDLIETWRAGHRLRWDRSGQDVWITLLWPVLLFALARWTRLLGR
jgi:uncharacterized membrane protein YjdF